MNIENKHGFLAVAADGTARTINRPNRFRARAEAKEHPAFKNTEVIGLASLDEIARGFARLAAKVKADDAAKLGHLVGMLGTLPESTIQEVFLELTRRTLAGSNEPPIAPFEIDESKLAGLEKVENASWSGNLPADSAMVIDVVTQASRAGAIIEPDHGEMEVLVDTMPVGGRGAWPSEGVFIRLLVTPMEHIVGDLLPLEDTDFFESCVDLAGTEEGPEFGKAVLTMVLVHAAIIWNGFLDTVKREQDRILATTGKEA